MKVWMDDWQLQCCGESFSVGDLVSWTVVEPDEDYLSTILGGEADGIDYAEEHHSDNKDLPQVTGRVRSIHAVHCQFVPSRDNPKMFYPEADSCVLVAIETADGFEQPPPGLAHRGYLVVLN